MAQRARTRSCYGRSACALVPNLHLPSAAALLQRPSLTAEKALEPATCAAGTSGHLQISAGRQRICGLQGCRAADAVAAVPQTLPAVPTAGALTGLFRPHLSHADPRLPS